MLEAHRHARRGTGSVPTRERARHCVARRRWSAGLLTVLFLGSATAPATAGSACEPGNEPIALTELVSRIEAADARYLFVGERHGVGPVKRFAVDLVNALVERGHEVGLYVEGFRTDCALEDSTCRTLASWFNPLAFDTLLLESRATVHAIDPPQRSSRGARMAEAIAAGSEAVRVVLIGDSHVRHAGDSEAELLVFGGALQFPDPGDVAEAFPRSEVVTIGLETSGGAGSRRMRADGCAVDYVVTTFDSSDYWAGSEEEVEIAGSPPFDGFDEPTAALVASGDQPEDP
ncbi:MAG TPA: hypothetical protein VMV46_04995 [Thermoanaerobaculia bacterium]|nr:hypothetical protein [Thermoanaerobaculia bacterium]